MSDLPEAMPAATLVLMRDRAGGPPELWSPSARPYGLCRGCLVFRRAIDRRIHEAAACSGGGGEDRGDPRDDRRDGWRRASSRRPMRRRSSRCATNRAGRSSPIACRGRLRLDGGADALRALVSQFPRDAALRHPVLPRRGDRRYARADGPRGRGGARLLGERCRGPRRLGSGAGARHLPHNAQSGAAGALRLDRRGPRGRGPLSHRTDHPLDRGARRGDARLHSRGARLPDHLGVLATARRR